MSMKITLSPQRRDDTLEVVKTGDVLTLNGESFDFSSIPDGGGIYPDYDAFPFVPAVPCDWIIGAVTRTPDGDLQLTIINPTGPMPTQWADWPEPIIDPPDGPVDIPWSSYTVEDFRDVEGGVERFVTLHQWHRDPEEIEVQFIEDVQLRAAREAEEAAAKLKADETEKEDVDGAVEA